MGNPRTPLQLVRRIVSRIGSAAADRYSIVRLFRDRRLRILALANVLDTMSTTVIVPVLPSLAQDLGASAFVIGLLFTAPAVAGAVFQAPAGYLSDRRGRRPFISTGMTLSAFPVIAIAFAWSPLVLVALRGMDGLLRAFVSPATNAYIGDAYPEAERGQAFGAYHTAGMVGAAAGPVLGGLLAEVGGVRLPFLVLGVGTLLGGVLLLLFLPSVEHEPTADSTRGSGLLPDVSRLSVGAYLSVPVAAWLVTVFVDQFGSTALRPSISLLLQKTVGRGPAYVGITYSALALAMLVFLPVGGVVADRVGRVRALAASYAGWTVVMVGLAVTTHPLVPPALMFLGGVLSALAVPALYALRYEIAPDGKEATFSGITGIAESVGEAAGPLFAGLAMGLWGVQAAVAVAGLAFLTALPLIAFVIPRAGDGG